MPGRLAPLFSTHQDARWQPDTPLPDPADQRPAAMAARLAVLQEAAPFIRNIELADQYAMPAVNGEYYVNVRPSPALDPGEERPIPATGLGRKKTGFFDLGGLRAVDPDQAHADREADLDRFLAFRRTDAGTTELVVVTQAPAEDRAVTRGRFWKGGEGSIRLFTPEDEREFVARQGYPRSAPDRFVWGQQPRPLGSPLTEAAAAMPLRVSWIAQKQEWNAVNYGKPEHPLVIEARQAHLLAQHAAQGPNMDGMGAALAVLEGQESLAPSAVPPRLRGAGPTGSKGFKV